MKLYVILSIFYVITIQIINAASSSYEYSNENQPVPPSSPSPSGENIPEQTSAVAGRYLSQQPLGISSSYNKEQITSSNNYNKNASPINSKLKANINGNKQKPASRSYGWDMFPPSSGYSGINYRSPAFPMNAWPDATQFPGAFSPVLYPKGYEGLVENIGIVDPYNFPPSTPVSPPAQVVILRNQDGSIREVYKNDGFGWKKTIPDIRTTSFPTDYSGGYPGIYPTLSPITDFGLQQFVYN